MDSIGIIASVIAAIATIITLVFSIRNSKGNITKRIEQKEREIHEIEHQFTKTYGLFADIRRHPSSSRIDKLQDQINELKKRI